MFCRSMTRSVIKAKINNGAYQAVHSEGRHNNPIPSHFAFHDRRFRGAERHPGEARIKLGFIIHGVTWIRRGYSLPRSPGKTLSCVRWHRKRALLGRQHARKTRQKRARRNHNATLFRPLTHRRQAHAERSSECSGGDNYAGAWPPVIR